MATLQQLERALVAADRAGDMDAARKLAAAIRAARQDVGNLIPTEPTAAQAAAGAVAPVAPAAVTPMPDTRNAGIVDTAIGTGEALLATGTGLTTGAVGLIGGTLKGLAEQLLSGEFGTREAAQAVERAAMEGAQALTYAPRTASGQAQTQAVGEFAQNLVPLAGMAPQMAAAGQAAGVAAPAVQAATAANAARVVSAARPVVARAQQAVAPAVQAVRDVLPGRSAEPMPTPGTFGSVGAAGTDMATQRIATAESLPVPVRLTRGQATRDFEQLRFEGETAKDPTQGARLRARADEQNKAILDNFDAWLDQTGARAPDIVSANRSIVSALTQRAAADKAQVRAAYNAADKSPGAAEPVNLQPLADFLNQNRAGRSSAPILQTIADELAVQELGGGSLADGSVAVGTVTIKQAEALRKAINRFAKPTDPNDMRVAGELKSIIDAQTEGVGGPVYAKARELRRKYADTYENRAVVADLLQNRKNMADPKVAIDKVFARSVLQGSPEDVKFLRRTLLTAGSASGDDAARALRENGQQAWREVQGAALNYIREEATKGVATNQRGDPVISAAGLNRAIRTLDQNGRLQEVFGRKGAQQLRDVNEIAKVVLTVPPGTVNTSNTASVLLAAIAEAGVGGATMGLPVPVLTGLKVLSMRVKDRRIQQRVTEALREAQREELKRKTGAANRMPAPKTIQ